MLKQELCSKKGAVMREIKFRAWDKKTNTMINEYAYTIDHGELTTVQFHSRLESPELVLMQYTGLKDKNGKEIYEGDRFKISANTPYNRFKYEIFWREYKWIAKQIGQEFYLDMNNLPGEIIGNIYESDLDKLLK